MPNSDQSAPGSAFQGFNLVTYVACGSSNSQLLFHADGTIRSNDGYSKGQCLSQVPCDSTAVPPCSLPASWGWTFVIALAVCSTLYVAGGVGYAVKVQGESPSSGHLALHPHHSTWVALGGLLSDGAAFAMLKARQYRDPAYSPVAEAGAPKQAGKKGAAAAAEPPSTLASPSPAAGFTHSGSEEEDEEVIE